MEDRLVQVLFALFGLYAGVMSWLFKSVWSDFKELKKDHDDLKLKVAGLRAEILTDVDQKFYTFLGQLDVKLDGWWNKIECNLMNDGRLTPKRSKKDA